MIDKNRIYKTRDGREVRIYATDGGNGSLIHGAVKNGLCWDMCRWHIDGKASLFPENGEGDLIEVRPRIQRTVWVNVYEDSTHGAYPSRKLADEWQIKNEWGRRLACVRVEIDCEEGEGL